MKQHMSPGVVYAALTGLSFVFSGAIALADPPASGQGRKTAEREKAGGVVLKAEPVDKAAAGGARAWRLTFNNDAVWRDYVRDQAVRESKAKKTSTDKAAARGRESVEAEGHPRSEQQTITVVLEPQTEITMRYRSSTDSIGEGASTPEGAAKAEAAADRSEDRASSGVPSSTKPDARRDVLKPRKLEPGELKPGLWVEVEFHQDKDKSKDLARRVTVMRPVGGPDTSAEKEKRPTTTRTPAGR